jgi:hypothetical protein
MTYVAFSHNETISDVPLGDLVFTADDPEFCKRLKAPSGEVLPEVIVDVVALRIRSKAKTSFLRMPDGRWLAVSAGSAYIFMFGRYNMEQVNEYLSCQ